MNTRDLIGCDGEEVKKNPLRMLDIVIVYIALVMTAMAVSEFGWPWEWLP